MDPGLQAGELIASEIADLTGETPQHEPEAARLPSGGIADFRFPADSLGDPGRFLLVEVKSLHDVASGTRHWLVDFAINHPTRDEGWSRTLPHHVCEIEVWAEPPTAPGGAVGLADVAALPVDSLIVCPGGRTGRLERGIRAARSTGPG